MKILHLTETYPPIIDGVAPAVYGSVSALRKLADCKVICPRMPDLPEDVLTYKSLGWVADGSYPLGFPYIPTGRFVHMEPDIIHAHSPFMSMILAERLRKKLDKPVVLSFHAKYSYDIEKYAKNMFSRKTASDRVLKSLYSADEVWIPSPGISAHLRELGYSGGHYVMENSTDLSDIEIEPDKLSELRARFSISLNETVLLFSGRMVWHKNLKTLINALDALHSMGVAFKMLFVGEGSDRESIEDYIADKRMDGITRFVGQVKEPEQLCAFYELADLLVFPSLSDNAPPSVIEAASRGLPSVLIRGSDASYGIEDGVTGFLCEEKDIAECIANVVSDKRRLKRVSATVKSSRRTSWDDVAVKMLARYEKILKL